MSIQVDHISYTYMTHTSLEKKALDDVAFTLEKGEFVALIGHTGSGKSTLAEHLNGLLHPMAGKVLVDGVDLAAKTPEAKAARNRVGMVFQYPEHQLFEVDVFSDVCFGPKNLGIQKDEIEKRAKEALQMVGLDESFYKQSPFDLSGGQKRRVAIAGVLAMKPEVLILDEPTAGLDPKGRDDILGLVQKLHNEQGLTIILVSHSMEDVARYVSRLVVMNHGEKVFDGTPKEVFRHYKELEAIGLAAPQITYVVHKLIDKGIPLDPDITTVEEAKNAILKIWREKNGKSSGNAAQVSTAGADSENAGHGNAAGTVSGNADITEKTAGEEKTC